jgi:putative nucleotidyltransferase with HDIG domain
MASLPWKARIYIFLLTALMAGAVFYSIPAIGFDSWIAVIITALMIAALDALPIDVHNGRIEITISDSIKFAIVLLYPVPVIIVGTWLGTLIGEIPAKRSWVKKVFNVSAMTVTWTIVSVVYLAIHQPQLDFFGSPQNLLALISAALSGFATNWVLVCLVISLTTNLPFGYVWLRNTRQLIWYELSMVPLGAFVAVLWRYNPVSVVLAILPLMVVRNSYKIANDLQGQTDDALRALVRVIDERDHHTLDHSERVSDYARSIADALDLPQDDIESIASAALLHDVGKVGMADDILFNPKILNPQERSRAQEHAEVGAMLLSKFPLFDKGAVLVKYHHERYDGTGYPDGLKGERIPLGSRIISVADAYQAMTEDRPYRRALSTNEAIAQLLAGSGTQFDPRVIQAFIQVLQKKSPKEEPVATTAPQLVGAGSTE